MSNSNLLGCKQTSVRGAWMIKSYKKLALFSCRTWWLFFLKIIKYVKFPHSIFIFVLRDFCYKTVLMVMTVSEGSTWYHQLLCSSLKYNWEETLLSVFLLDKLWQLQFRTDESTNTGQKHKSLSTLRLCSLKALVDCNHRIKLNLAHMVRSLFMWFFSWLFFLWSCLGENDPVKHHSQQWLSGIFHLLLHLCNSFSSLEIKIFSHGQGTSIDHVSKARNSWGQSVS